MQMTQADILPKPAERVDLDQYWLEKDCDSLNSWSNRPAPHRERH
jgi:hypothetical protein